MSLPWLILCAYLAVGVILGFFSFKSNRYLDLMGFLFIVAFWGVILVMGVFYLVFVGIEKILKEGTDGE